MSDNYNNNQQQQRKKNQNELAALWKKETKTGKKCLSGKFNIKDLREKIMAMGKDTEWVNVSVFVNGFKKEGSRQPDYSMMIFPMKGYQGPSQQNNQNPPQQNNQREHLQEAKQEYNKQQENHSDQYYDQDNLF